MRFLLVLPGLLFLVISWLSAINGLNRSSNSSRGRRSSAPKPQKSKPSGTAAIKPIVIRDEPPQQPKRKRGRPRKNPPKAATPKQSAPHLEASSRNRPADPATLENHSSAPAVQLTFPGFSIPANAATIGQAQSDPEPEFKPSIGQLGIYEIIYSH